VDLGGMYLTDNLSAPTKWQFPVNNSALTTIPAGGYLLIWIDDDTTDLGLHANFKLDAGGEEIGLFDSDGVTLIDSVTFGEQTADISYGRFPDAGEYWQAFGSPSPEAQNIGVYDGFVSDIEFSHERGFYGQSFYLTIATETEDATIYYTLDGSDPYDIESGGRFPKGTAYTGPILISRTACLKAIAVKTGWMPSDIKTHTYIFVQDVIRQSPNGQAPGAGWPTGNVRGQVIDYGMDPDIVNNSRWAGQMEAAMLDIPSISLVTDLANLFDSSIGIYVNAGNDGINWERRTSVELIYPDGTPGFGLDAGLRIRGAYSRTGNNPKHAFRLIFRNEYGAGKLRYPLFGDEGIDEFDKIDLRTSQNFSWSFEGDYRHTMIRDVFSRDVQRDMGQPYTRSRYYHLYINGHYWGIYQTQERADADFAESYLGGNAEDYDAIKNDSSGSRALHATDGNMDAYRRLYDAAVAGFSSNETYYAIQGLRPDGTPDPYGEKLLDPENLMDYMICTYYTGDPDAPVSCWGHFSNNVFAIYNRAGPEGFTWYRHDAEHSLGANLGGTQGLNECRLLTDSRDRSIGEDWEDFNPAWLHLRLTANAEYLMKFADRVNMYFSNGGLLTTTPNIQRWMERANQINLAIIAESARWGDAHRSRINSPRTKDDWEGQNDYMLNTFFPARTQIVINQMRSVNMFPNTALVSFNPFGGEISENFELVMSQSNGTSGTIYYTLDGSDPRASDAPVSASVIVPEDAAKRTIVPTGPISDDWKGGGDFEDSDWISSAGAPGGGGFERTSGYQDYFSLDLLELMYGRNASCYVRIPFTIDANYSSLTLNVRYDDGFVAYINGAEVARRNFDGTPAWDSRASASHSDSAAVLLEGIDITDFIDTLQQGDNILAIQAMNSSTTSSDFLISAELVAKESVSDDSNQENVMEYTGPITLSHSVIVKARVQSGGTWGALTEAVYAAGPVAESLRITEIMYNPSDPNEEFIELKNIGADTINLNLVSFMNGIDFTFPSIELAAGEHIVVIRNRYMFETRYGKNINIAGQYSGKLDNAGERIELQDAIGRTILNFRYENGWRSITDGEGFSLTIIDETNPDLNSWGEKDSWRPSAYAGGSPGSDDSGIIPNPGSIVFNEVLAHAHAEEPDWIELHNTTSATIDIGGWFLSDSKDDLFKYKIPNGTTIGPNGYFVLYEDLNFGNENDPATYEPFALSENGERLYLSSTKSGVLTGYREVEDFGPSETGVSFGRYHKSGTGNYNFVAMEENTPGLANTYPKVGPIVISEIMYHPDWPDGGTYTNEQYEYIELHNISAEPVALYDYAKGEPWKFTNGVDFTFPTYAPVTIEAGGYILVVKKPEAFSTRYPNLPDEIIFGPYDGNLSNSGESLELSMPGDVNNENVRQYIRVDRINYSDGSHPEDCPGGVDLWPTEADGNGTALTRKIMSDYGNDPENWLAAASSPGQ
ncbi:MAG: lamin tail domain-containing protein, partial [Sedimentisphaerales bacterium]|nr:lamin tail domain-containing protein [Sedimentisphaerales bacterium]